MTKIVIGKSNGKNVGIDLDILLRTRLLIQANSGGGKSWLIRRLVEQLFGNVQVIIVDPEGEFATLREKFGFVLVGDGGETPADPRSAGMVAEKLLELRASAVCDLFESFRKTPQNRHAWTKNFCNALLDAPKKLWHPVVLVIDEFHKFVPEKGAGESEASEAVIGCGTAGRKRGICLVGATQRLSKVRKDVSAELLNRFVGPTFEDVDLKRAADLLSVLKEDEKEFFAEMKVLEPGNFYALGRAISKTRLLVKIGSVETTHPEMGSSKHASGPPPAPEAVAKLLPKLADLPKQAEEKAKTEAEYKTQIRSLKAQLVAKAQVSQQPTVDVKKIQVAVKEAQSLLLKEVDARDKTIRKLLIGLGAIAKDAAALAGVKIPPVKLVTVTEPPKRESALRQSPPRRDKEIDAQRVPPEQNNGDVTGPEQRILNAIAWMESIGITEPEQTAVAFLAGYTYGGGGFNNPRGALRTKGLVEYRGDRLALTTQGHHVARAPETPLTTEELHSHVLSVLPGPEQKLLKVLLEIHPEDISKDELAERAGYTAGSGGFNNPCGRLRTLGLVDYPQAGRVIAKDILFVE